MKARKEMHEMHRKMYVLQKYKNTQVEMSRAEVDDKKEKQM